MKDPSESDFGGLCGTIGGHSDVTDILCAEILALLRGLELCCDHGFRNVVCYSDSKAAVDLGRTAFSSFIRTAFKQRVDSISSALPERERNQCADSLAKLGVDQEDAFVVLPIPPSVLNLALMADMSCRLEAKRDAFRYSKLTCQVYSS
ncbi:hypothetical protein JHK84_053423 [Glycine max]|nr:hypothetical protein JHK84_053423 [Glycine max]